MRSDQWTWRPPPAPAIADCTEPAEVPKVKPVWVLLEKLYRPAPRATKTVIDGLDLERLTVASLIESGNSALCGSATATATRAKL